MARKEPRAASTYRGARRNLVLRDLKTVWGPDWYYKQHDAKFGRTTVLSRHPSRHHPIDGLYYAWQKMKAQVREQKRVFRRPQSA